MFTAIRTSYENKSVVSDLTKKLSLGPENVIARLAFAYSLSTNRMFKLTDIHDSKGKEYNKNVLFGNNISFYISMICIRYNLYKTDKDIPKYIKIHIDHGLELISKVLKDNPNISGFDFLVDKIEDGLKYL